MKGFCGAMVAAVGGGVAGWPRYAGSEVGGPAEGIGAAPATTARAPKTAREATRMPTVRLAAPLSLDISGCRLADPAILGRRPDGHLAHRERGALGVAQDGLPEPRRVVGRRHDPAAELRGPVGG